MDSANAVKRPPGVFYFEGAPIQRGTIEKSFSHNFRKALYCGYCGVAMKKYKCKECSRSIPMSQMDATQDHEEILEAWKDGEYHSNMQQVNTKRPPSEHGDNFSFGDPSMSRLTEQQFKNGYAPNTSAVSSACRWKGPKPTGSGGGGGWGGGSITKERDMSGSLAGSDALGGGGTLGGGRGRAYPPSRAAYGSSDGSTDLSRRNLPTDNGPLFDNLEWTTALLMGWRSHEPRAPREDEEMSYNFKRHLFIGKKDRTDDHFKMRPRTKKQFNAEHAYQRLFLPSHSGYKLSGKLLTGTFHVDDYNTLEKPEEVAAAERGWKTEESKQHKLQPYSKRFAHLLYGPGSQRDPKNKGFMTKAEHHRKIPSLADGGDASSVGSTDGSAAIAAGAGATSPAGDTQLPRAKVRVLAPIQDAPVPKIYRAFRSTGGEDRPHYVDRSRDHRRMKI